MRVRTMKKPHSAEFSAKLETRYTKFVQNLNNTMLPLVGTSSSIVELHKAIANAAQDLNMLISAYDSKYQSIYPRLEELFDGKEHTVHDPRLVRYVGKPILLSKMFGLKVKIGNGEWRICQQADVAMLSDAKPPKASAVPQKRTFDKIAD